MGPLALSDIALVQKLETVAAVTNEDLLSDEEISRGRAILMDVRAQIASLSEKASMLSIAVAPHKRLPLDLLQEIFLAMLPSEQNHSVSLPPVLSDVPWLLGQVCSAWRHLSRSMPTLWGLSSFTIEADHTKKISSFLLKHTDIETNQRLFKSGVSLERALEFLPSASQISVHVHDDLQSFQDTIVPFLGHVDHLFICMKNFTEQEVLNALPFHSLSNITSLMFEFEPMQSTSAVIFPDHPVKLFGDTSRLETLHVNSSTTNLLLLDYPWHQLIYLTLAYPTHVSGVSPPINLDREFKFSPFRHGICLKLLTLRISEQLLNDFITLDIPWHQLNNFNVSCYTSHGFDAIMQAVEKCRSESSLSLSIQTTTDWTHGPVMVHSPQSLILYSTPIWLINSPIFWENISDLQILVSLPGDQLIHVLNSCPRLTHLHCELRLEENLSDIKIISLPYLKTLEIYVNKGFIFARLATPALLHLTVTFKGRGHLPDIESIIGCIQRSECKLTHFTFDTWDFSDAYDYLRLNLGHLLRSVSSCSHVNIAKMTVSAEVLESIACRTLLPDVENLQICCSSFTTFISMLELRMETEEKMGKRQLRYIAGTGNGADYVKGCLMKLHKKYQVQCSFWDYKAPSPWWV